MAAALAAWPAAARFEPSLFWQAFAVCTAACALVMAPLSSALAGPSASRPFRRAMTLGVLFAAVPLLPFASILKTATHHRPLGGVTFAVIAGFSVLSSALLGARLITWSGAQRPTVRALARFAIVALAALGGAAVLLGLMQGLRSAGSFRTGFFDALRVLGLATLAARLPEPPALLRRWRGFGLAAWISVVTVGVCLGRVPAMQAELAIRCPVLQWPLLWLGG